MIYLTTFFDKNYLSRGLVLFNSLKKHESNFELFILCLDDFTFNYFESNKHEYLEIKLLQLIDIENDNQELLIAKENRTKIEYYFTLSPILPLYLLKKYQIPHICSLDADILFLNSPISIFNNLKNFSIIITPHKFSVENIEKEIYGKYNVSFQIFKNNSIGIQCLEYWKKQCLEYCTDKLDLLNDRFADQKYLDKWEKIYPNEILTLHDNISGLAPWNINNYKIKSKDSNYYSDEDKIIFYHFHKFKIFSDKWASNGFDEYKVKQQIDVDILYNYYWNQINFYDNKLINNQVISIRYHESKSILSKLMKEKIVYNRINNNMIKLINYNWIPKQIRKLLIKING